jgi:hypothetical protein
MKAKVMAQLLSDNGDLHFHPVTLRGMGGIRADGEEGVSGGRLHGLHRGSRKAGSSTFVRRGFSIGKNLDLRSREVGRENAERGEEENGEAPGFPGASGVANGEDG